MRFPRPSDRPRALAAAAFALLMLPAAAHAQRGMLLQGLFDAEAWATDSASRLLARNAGHPGALARLRLWSAVEPWKGVVLFAEGQVEGGNARADEEQLEVYVEQFGLRIAPSRALVIEAGKLTHPVGAFASRRFSDRNPLIGSPDGYPVEYPLGASVSGAAGRFDYHAAAVSLPLTHENYLPGPTPRLRPALAAGITLAPGLRIGASGTWGPYLGDSLPASLLVGKPWQSYEQQIVAIDAQVSYGYLETHVEAAKSRYDVPVSEGVLHGFTYYVEAKYTLSPRVYLAGRYERNEYPYLQPLDAGSWMARVTNVYNSEGGVGYRLSASRLIKMTYRADSWRVDPFMRSFLPNGHAVAVQVSQSLDFSDLLRRR